MKKTELQAMIEENINKHEIEYNEAVGKYKIAAVKYHENLLDHFKSSEGVPSNIKYDPPTKPVPYKDRLEKAIKMLSYDTRDIIMISSLEFDEFVNLNFHERHNFLGAVGKNNTYLS